MSGNVYKMNFADNKLLSEVTDFPNQEWIKAGIKILREHGVMGISIATLCKELDREESDFNKAFNGLESFAFALLDYWYEKETLKYIEIVDEVVGDAEKSLLTMMEVIHYADKKDEISIRNWALMCPNA
ncbi:MAG: hypothetical protein P8H03_10860, partial [Emcibacteraceae bacterium]|nr:hypothetical protein [Emcibacteraceae bacterium]